jgi:hypothetical protein
VGVSLSVAECFLTVIGCHFNERVEKIYRIDVVLIVYLRLPLKKIWVNETRLDCCGRLLWP